MEGLAELAVKSTALTTVECDLVFRNDFTLIPDCIHLAVAADEARRAVWLLLGCRCTRKGVACRGSWRVIRLHHFAEYFP